MRGPSQSVTRAIDQGNGEIGGGKGSEDAETESGPTTDMPASFSCSRGRAMIEQR